MDNDGDGTADVCVPPLDIDCSLPENFVPSADGSELVEGVPSDGTGDGVADTCLTPDLPAGLPELPEQPDPEEDRNEENQQPHEDDSHGHVIDPEVISEGDETVYIMPDGYPVFTRVSSLGGVELVDFASQIPSHDPDVLGALNICAEILGNPVMETGRSFLPTEDTVSNCLYFLEKTAVYAVPYRIPWDCALDDVAELATTYMEEITTGGNSGDGLLLGGSWWECPTLAWDCYGCDMAEKCAQMAAASGSDKDQCSSTILVDPSARGPRAKESSRHRSLIGRYYFEPLGMDNPVTSW